jgi:phosphatidylglycerophosphate synthase
MVAVHDSPWALLLLLPLITYFLARFAFYYSRKALGREVPFDREMSERGHSLLIGASVRQVYAWSLQPFVRVLAKARVQPNTLTIACFVLSALAGALIAVGAVALGGVIGLLGASLDYFDGRIARMSGQVTASGGFLDSTLDRYGEVAFLAGAAALFRASPLTLTACLLALGASGIVSYARAKAESLGVELKSGLMQRPERVVMFCFGACSSTALDPLLPLALRGQHGVFSAVLILLACLTTHTSVSRTAAGFQALRRAEARHRYAGSAPSAPRAGALRDGSVAAYAPHPRRRGLGR